MPVIDTGSKELTPDVDIISHFPVGAVAPHIIVSYRDTRRAYGRAWLKSLGSGVSRYSPNVPMDNTSDEIFGSSLFYQLALWTLRQQFGLRRGTFEDSEQSWDTRVLVTFSRTHGRDDRCAFTLHDASWDELIDNVAKIELDPVHTMTQTVHCFQLSHWRETG